jgi:hypothetical protein
MANAAVLKTAVRKDLGVRIPRPPLYVTTSCAASDPGKHVGPRGRLDTCLHRRDRSMVLAARLTVLRWDCHDSPWRRSYFATWRRGGPSSRTGGQASSVSPWEWAPNDRALRPRHHLQVDDVGRPFCLASSCACCVPVGECGGSMRRAASARQTAGAPQLRPAGPGARRSCPRLPNAILSSKHARAVAHRGLEFASPCHSAAKRRRSVMSNGFRRMGRPIAASGAELCASALPVTNATRSARSGRWTASQW